MDLDTLRHSCSHVMAQAVKELFPDVKLGIGPSIEDGFYYDFDKKEPFLPEDLEKIEKKMRQIIGEKLPFLREELSKPDAIELLKKLNEPYKIELIEGIPDEKVSIYKTGDKFIDLCRGPHINNTGEITTFKLLSIAGAYWRGSETNPMLQRIYATAFLSQKDLDDFLKQQEEALKRDHRKLGPALGYFDIIPDKIGAGLVLYHPKGALLRMIIENYEKEEHLRRGYEMVIGPHIMRSDIWVTSGHYEYYKENMYIFKIDGQEYAIKPMNCPGHILVYKSKTRSYRDLPIRYYELGTVYRHEKSGVLHGLLRVRGFTQDDAHIFCREDQLVDEIADIIDFVADTLKVFGFDNFEVEISTKPKKAIGSDEIWKQATDALIGALNKRGVTNYQINEGEGAFYGPKIDIKLKDALKRSWQCATIQCDFNLPERFDLEYIGVDGLKHRPIMLHRVLLGSLERFIGTLLEHYAGALPTWISPVQAVIIPISEAQADFAQDLKKKLLLNNIRVELDCRNEKMQYRLREAITSKAPYSLIVGEKEATQNSVSVRDRSNKQEVMSVDAFIEKIKKEVSLKGGGVK